MNDILIQVVLGTIQGVTEWLPISSSGHLALLEKIFGFTENLPYDVFLHVASLIVLIVYFWKDLLRLARAPFKKGMGESRQELWHIVIAMVPTIVVALLLQPFERYFRTPVWLAVFFAVNAILLFMSKGARHERSITVRDALIIGFVQGLAVIPALSRSAITIAVALRLGVSRGEAFRFSFLISIPALTAAAVSLLGHLAWRPVYLIGFVVTLITGYASLRLLQTLVMRDKVHWFWIYNILLAVIILFYAG